MSNLLELREKLQTAVDLGSQVLLEKEEAETLVSTIQFSVVEDYKHMVIAVLNGLLVTANVTGSLGRRDVVNTAISITDMLIEQINAKGVVPSIRR